MTRVVLQSVPRLCPLVIGIVGLGLVALSGPGPQGVAHATQPVRIVLGPPFISDSLTDLATEITAALEQGLAHAKLTVERPPVGEPMHASSPCETLNCKRALGLRLGADVIITSEIRSSPRAFTVGVTITRTHDGATLSSETLTCEADDPCPPIAQSVHDVAHEAARKALPRVREMASEDARESFKAGASRAPEQAELATNEVPDTRVAVPQRGRLPPAFWVTSLAVGIGTTSLGVSLLMLDGEQIRVPLNTRARYRDYFFEGVATTAGGALLITGTVLGYLLWDQADTQQPRFAIGPGRLLFAGRF